MTTKREESERVAKDVADYLARGGVIHLIPRGYISDKKDQFMNRKPVVGSYRVWRAPQFEDV